MVLAKINNHAHKVKKMTLTIEKLAEEVGTLLQKKNLRLAVAESCTGGGVCYFITSIPGSSNWFDCGFVTYTDAAKQAMLDVNPMTLKAYGAVSEQTALEMAQGALNKSKSDISLAITGIAGPTGGTPLKPVGTVWIAYAKRTMPATAKIHIFTGDRQAIRTESIESALKGLLSIIK